MSTPTVVLFRFESHEFRALTIAGNPWFVAKDVCDVLDLDNVTRATSGLDDDELTLLKVRAGGQDREVNCVSESGLYTLIIRSNKPQAKSFRKWVTAEVLPSIRKTGGYNQPAGRKTRVDFHHHRGPVSSSGLDIRYTLDLTKIITSPKTHTLALLERLTGVTVTDLDISDSQSNQVRNLEEMMALVDRFASEQVIDDPLSAALFRDVYARFLLWYGSQGFNINYVPSLKAVSAWCDRNGYRRRKPCGQATIYGLRLVAAEVLA